MDDDGEPLPSAHAVFLRDDTQSIITFNDSPDIPFRAGLNPYRGCEHGCAYCFARPDARVSRLLRRARFRDEDHGEGARARAAARGAFQKIWEPQPVAMSGVTDVYQPVERRLQLTRACLEVFAEFRNPVAIITKNHLVTRDFDLLAELARHRAVSVAISLTTLDGELAKALEPRASSPTRRLAAIEELSRRGHAGARADGADHSRPDRSRNPGAARGGGARRARCGASYTILRLPCAVAPLFEAWLERHAPGHKEKVLGRIRELRGGKLYDSRWGARMSGEGALAAQIKALFTIAKRKAGLDCPREELSSAAFRVPTPQLSLF